MDEVDQNEGCVNWI